jgi:ATP adenylyltransferase/5',5'''-P-1,P-4-tetraphosphate phosphorylase II
MLEISRNLFDYTIFYNGPRCGASAPDHFHFQAGSKGLLQLESEFDNLADHYSETIFKNKEIEIIAVENYLRRFVAVVSKNRTEIDAWFRKIYTILEADISEEPMINVLCNYEKGEWRIFIFPRAKQRPSHFFRTDENQIIVGPAAVELGGLVVLPREEDFRKITKKDIAEIYEEVTINKTVFRKLIAELKL